jgi:SulP family sulfate permease
VVLYQIAGPLFFGAAQKAMSAMDKVAGDVLVVILDISSVPVMDATGLVNLESALERLADRHALVVLVGVQAQPGSVLRRAGIDATPGQIAMCSTLGEATEVAKQHLGRAPAPSSAA